MSAGIALILLSSSLGFTPHPNVTHENAFTNSSTFYELPRFWTNSGFCPPGLIKHSSISRQLNSYDVQMNLQQIAALPTGAITHVRIHWLLELLRFVQYTQTGLPIYDYDQLDEFLMMMDDLSLAPHIEFMGNPGNVFKRNPSRNAVLWENFAYQVVNHYLNLFGAAKVVRWRFEAWNEPDLAVYNKLHFTVPTYWEYLNALRFGLDRAGHRAEHSLHLPLRGPAGLFKKPSKHPLCWNTLKLCNLMASQCPVQLLTYHRKGEGRPSEILNATQALLQKWHKKFTNLRDLPVSNSEADLIAGWSTPRPQNEDVRYAALLILNVMNHWQAKLKMPAFAQLESISHDNAFLSYHPHEFSQRSLLARFQMNNSQPVYSQFIQKPVYAAMGMLAKLSPMAEEIEIIRTGLPDAQEIWLLKTSTASTKPLVMSWLLVPAENCTDFQESRLQLHLPIPRRANESYAFIVEALQKSITDPVEVWRTFGSPSYPNATVREEMRRRQAPQCLGSGLLSGDRMLLNISTLNVPWVVQVRVCSDKVAPLIQPHELSINGVTTGEVFITWREVLYAAHCLRSYELWFRREDEHEWLNIAVDWHVPFPNFHYAPKDGKVNGFYKVRGVDVFNAFGPFSESVEYVEL